MTMTLTMTMTMTITLRCMKCMKSTVDYCCYPVRKISCSFYGSPLWNLNGPGVQSLCVDWRKSLRSLWRVHPRCDIIAALSEQTVSNKG